MLLDKGGSEVVRARDSRGDLALHMAAQQGHPMCTYNLAKVGPGFPSLNGWGFEQRAGVPIRGPCCGVGQSHAARQV